MKYQTIKIIEWATGDDTGSSSLDMCRFMLGLEPRRRYYERPYDKADRGRCIRMLNEVPEWWDRVDEMRGLSTEWDKQITLIKEER